MRQLRKLLLPALVLTGIVVLSKSKTKKKTVDEEEDETEDEEKIAV